MSKWSEFGYPDPAGVPIQTALHGLTAALKERFRAETVSQLENSEILDVCERMEATPLFQAVLQIENLFAEFDNFLLPDNTAFSLENAAAFLQEELILPPDSMPRNYAYFAEIYAWCTQRYRFLNLAYKVLVSHSWLEVSFERWKGNGSSLTEASRNLKKAAQETSGFYKFETVLSVEKSSIYYNLEKTLYIPRRLQYPFAVPGLLCLAVEATMPGRYAYGNELAKDTQEFTIYPAENHCRKWLWDDFNTGLVCGEKQLFASWQIPGDLSQNALFELDGPYKDAVQRLEDVSFPSPPENFQYSQLVTGFITKPCCYCDFREQLQFYDPPEIYSGK